MFDRYEFFRNLYFHELERRQSLLGLVAPPVTLTGLVAGTLGYVATHFKFGGTPYRLSWLLESLFWGATLAAATLLAYVGWHIARILAGPGYKHLPEPPVLLDHLRKLERWHRTAGSREPANAADRDFADGLIGELAKSSGENWHHNRVQSMRLWRANSAVAGAAVALVVAMICYYADFLLDSSTSS
ncbi:MAG: hypothetical protein HC855_04945 [Rhizobiales bacterium]|nr:hypothetical protein [Hyphomicrobiales bacterium]